MHLLRSALIAAVFAVTACKHSTAPEPTVTGSWRGNAPVQYLSFALAQTGNVVTGSGTLAGTSQGTVALNVNGTFARPNLSITLASPMIQPFNFTGTLTEAGTLTGILSGNGFYGQPVTLLRQ